jgi:hypothetical protein
MDTLEDKLKRLRKLWTLAKSRNNKGWMERIEKDALRLKEQAQNKIGEKTVGEMTNTEIEAILGVDKGLQSGILGSCNEKIETTSETNILPGDTSKVMNLPL